MKIKEEPALVRALNGLAQNFSGKDRDSALQTIGKAAIKVVRGMSSEHCQADVIEALFDYMTPEEVGRASNRVQDTRIKARLAGVLASKLGGDAKNRALNEALEQAFSVKDEPGQAQALKELARYLSQKQISRVVRKVKKFKSDFAFAEFLRAFLQYLSTEQKYELRERAKQVEDKEEFADIVSAVTHQRRSVSIMMPFGGDSAYSRRYYKLHYNRLKEIFRLVKVEHNGLPVD